MPEAQSTTSGSSGTYINGVRQWTVSELQRLVGLHQEREARADLLCERLEAERDRLRVALADFCDQFGSPGVNGAILLLPGHRPFGEIVTLGRQVLAETSSQLASKDGP